MKYIFFILLFFVVDATAQTNRISLKKGLQIYQVGGIPVQYGFGMTGTTGEQEYTLLSTLAHFGLSWDGSGFEVDSSEFATQYDLTLLGGDDWGSDVVNTDITLTGNGTVGNVLKVDTTIIATQFDLILGGSYSDELAQDATGAMIDGSLTYVDATPRLQRSALTGAITAALGNNNTLLGSFTKAELDGAVSDGNVLYVGDDHGSLGGLTDDDHLQYPLLLGRAGSQILYGGTAANEDITLHGTFHATKTTSYVLLQPSGGFVGIGNSTPATLLDIGTYNTTGYNIRTGTFVLQPYAINNGFIADNAYYNAGWTRLTTGYVSGFQFYNGQLIVFNATTGTGSFTQTPILKTDYANSGTVGLGGNMSINSNDYTGSVMVVRGTGRVGIATTSSDNVLEINLGTTGAFRKTYNDANGSASTYSDETISSTGVVTFDAVGSAPAFIFSDDVNVPNEAYDATAWNGSTEAANKDAIRDKIESMSAGHTLRDDGSDMTTRTGANFVSTSTINAALTDDAGNNETEISLNIVSGSVGNTELSTGIDVTQFADGSVTDAEFQFINTVTSNVQTQLDGKLKQVSVQVKTSGSGTYTPTTGTQYVLVICVGGGGGAAAATGADEAVSGGGGGGTAIELYTVAAATGQPYVVAATSTGAGNTSGFGTANALLQATGGGAGTATGNSTASMVRGGAGGVGTLGDINMTGQGGSPGITLTTAIGCGGNGGSSFYGGGGRGGVNTTTFQQGEAGGNFGGGAGGGHTSDGTDLTAVAGAAGIMYFIEFVSN